MATGFFRKFTKRILIVVNVIVALLFLAGGYGYLFNPIYFWPVGFLTLSVFYFLLILVALLIFWLFVKPRLAFISVVALLLAYGPVKNIIPYRLSAGFNMKKQDSSLRIMSWNVAQFNVLNNKKHPEVKNQMIDLINEYNPDIACFQEMVAEDSTVIKHGDIKDFLKRLKFPYYFYSYNRKDDFWDYAHFGVIIFSKYLIINEQTMMWYPNNYNSNFQYADIVKNADTFRLFNIHLQSLRFSRENLKYIDKPSVEKYDDIRESKNIFGKLKMGFVKRKTQADRTREAMNMSPYPVIVCGDFNDVPNSYAYHTIGNGMKNAFVEKGAGLGRTFSGISTILRIDNIFVDETMDVLQFKRIKKKLSDHFPVIADIRMRKK